MKKKSSKRWTAIITFLKNKQGKQCELLEIKLGFKADSKEKAMALVVLEASKTWTDYSIRLDAK